jgi:hydroxymethylglutaryl-CoA reductase
MADEERFSLPPRFRKLPIHEKRRYLQELLELTDDELAATGCTDGNLELADVMVESAVGFMPVPLGITSGIRVDGKTLFIPMATEEPSVIAAAGYAGRLISMADGLRTSSDPPVMTAQIYLEGSEPGAVESVERYRAQLEAAVAPVLTSMSSRGGGLVDVGVETLSEPSLLRIHLYIDVRDAMGANILNSAAEASVGALERITGGKKVMAILSNSARRRRARAEFEIDVDRLARAGLSGSEMARRIELASRIAESDPNRAVTHNKGIMNGISALALATGNDTRGTEAAAHAFAARDGRYTSLSRYRSDGETLRGSVELPIALGSVGGAVGIHPVSSFSLKLLGDPNSTRLARTAAALGLAQNFAALLALVSEGIQSGHMRLHSERLAYRAGAREKEIRKLAKKVFESGSFNISTARRLLEELRKNYG